MFPIFLNFLCLLTFSIFFFFLTFIMWFTHSLLLSHTRFSSVIISSISLNLFPIFIMFMGWGKRYNSTELSAPNANKIHLTLSNWYNHSSSSTRYSTSLLCKISLFSLKLENKIKQERKKGIGVRWAGMEAMKNKNETNQLLLLWDILE